jgi:hypothetical protein
MKNQSSYWIKTLQNGLIGGGISLLLGVVGLSLAFGKLYVISGVITMGEIFVLSPFLFEAYMSVRHAPSKEPGKLLMTAGLTGLVGGGVLALFILIGQVVNLRAVLVNVSPDLMALLTFHLPVLPGVLVLLAVSLVTGLIAAGIFLLPNRIRGALSQAVMVVVLIGLFRDLIVTVIIHWGVVQYAFLWLFAASGLNIIGALVIFILIGAITYWSKGRDRKAIALKRNTRQQRVVRWSTLGILGLVTLLLPVILGSYFAEILDNVGIYPDGVGTEHRGWLCRLAGPWLCCVLRYWCLHTCDANHDGSGGLPAYLLLGSYANCPYRCSCGWSNPGPADPALARRLPGHCDPGIWRDHPHCGPIRLVEAHPGRIRRYPTNRKTVAWNFSPGESTRALLPYLGWHPDRRFYLHSSEEFSCRSILDGFARR